MGTHEEPLRQRFCRGIGCGRVFWICRHCYRGHKYCSHRCRQRRRTLQKRAARRKHQRSPEGRDDHRDHNRVYRARRRLRRVTDHTSPAPSDSDNIDPSEPSPSINGPGSGSGEARYAGQPEFEPACIICGRTRDRFSRQKLPEEAKTLIRERGNERAKCVPARTETQFLGALNRGLELELTREPESGPAGWSRTGAPWTRSPWRGVSCTHRNGGA